MTSVACKKIPGLRWKMNFRCRAMWNFRWELVQVEGKVNTKAMSFCQLLVNIYLKIKKPMLGTMRNSAECNSASFTPALYIFMFKSPLDPYCNVHCQRLLLQNLNMSSLARHKKNMSSRIIISRWIWKDTCTCGLWRYRRQRALALTCGFRRPWIIQKPGVMRCCYHSRYFLWISSQYCSVHGVDWRDGRPFLFVQTS